MQTIVKFNCQLEEGDVLTAEVVDNALFIGTSLVPDGERAYALQHEIRLNREQANQLVEFLKHQLTFDKFE